MTTREKALNIALGEVGVKEKPSNNVKYNTWYYGREVYDGLWGTTFPWCMAFVQWCYAQTGRPLPHRTASCSDLLWWYRRNAPECIVEDPAPGDIVIYDFGHTGIVYGSASTLVYAVEGNTSRFDNTNGGQVQKRQRRKTEVTAYIRPFIDEEDEDMDITKLTDAEVLTLGHRFLRLIGDAEIYALTQRANAHAGQLDAPDWAVDEYCDAIRQGITDGTRPLATVTRLEASLMAKRAAEKA